MLTPNELLQPFRVPAVVSVMVLLPVVPEGPPSGRPAAGPLTVPLREVSVWTTLLQLLTGAAGRLTGTTRLNAVLLVRVAFTIEPSGQRLSPMTLGVGLDTTSVACALAD